MYKRFVKFATYSLLFVGLITTSCKKEEPTPEPEPEKSKINAFHMVPNGPTVALFNGTTRLFGSATLTYPNNTGYQELLSGNYTFNINPAPDYSTPVASVTRTLAKDKFYSIFAVASDNMPNTVKAVAVEDDLSAPLAGKCKVRFFHFAKGAPSVDLLFNGTPQFSARPNQADATSFDNFISIDPNAGYNLQIRTTGGGNRFQALPNIRMEDGKWYTVIYRGNSGGTGVEAEQLTVFEHKK